jgi:hypothetical protein
MGRRAEGTPARQRDSPARAATAAAPVANVVKAILNNPIARAVIQIVGCTVLGPPTGGLGCAALSGALTIAAGGSVADGLKAFGFSFATMGIFSGISDAMYGLTTAFGALGHVMKAGVHGIIGGALSVAQGGSFLQGFASSAAGSLGGSIAGESGLFGEYRDGKTDMMLARAAVSGAAGCAGAVVTGGKCAEAAVTAAFASLYNNDALGKGGEQQVGKWLKAMGASVMGSQVSYYAIDENGREVTKDSGKRLQGRMDLLSLERQGPDSFMRSEEVKTGPGSKLDTNQKALAGYVATGSVVFYGDNARAANIDGLTAKEAAARYGATWGGLRIWGLNGSVAPQWLNRWFGRGGKPE